MKIRVRMIRCIGAEPDPPADHYALERWCAAGNSSRPIQTHIGEDGCVLWTNENGSLCVQFDDGDERLLFREEVEIVVSEVRGPRSWN